jgi:hypothetical protein
MAANAVGGKKPVRPSAARARTVPAAAIQPPQPAVLRFTSVADEPEEREPLFYIDDTEYTMLKNPSSTIGQEALHILAENGGSPLGQVMADDYVMTKMLGEEGYAALRACKTIKAADLAHLKQVVSQKALGALEGPNL